MKLLALFIFLILFGLGCRKQNKEMEKVAKPERIPVTQSKKANYATITGLWEDQEYLLNLRRYNSMTKADSLANFYTHLLYEGDSMMYGNKADLMEEDYFFVQPDNIIMDSEHRPLFTIKAFTDSVMDIELKARNKVKRYTKVLPPSAINGKSAAILFSNQLDSLTNKWFEGDYELLLSDSVRFKLTFKKNGSLLGHPEYVKYKVYSSRNKDILGLSGSKRKLGSSYEMIREANRIQLLGLNSIEDIDDPLLRTGTSFTLRKL